MRERLSIQQISCERKIAKLAGNLAPLKGLDEARIEQGTSTLIVDYDPAIRERLDTAITSLGLRIAARTPIE